MKARPVLCILDEETEAVLRPALIEIEAAILGDPELEAMRAEKGWPIDAVAFGYFLRRVFGDLESVDLVWQG